MILILNFTIFSNKRFQIGASVYPRAYRVREGRGGISLIHLKTGKYLYKNLNPQNIQIDGFPMQSIIDLQKVVYNMECVCSDDGETPEPKIFDLHFARQFE